MSNPTAARLGVAIPAAEAGGHLLIEKPASHSMEGIGSLRRAVDQGGGRVLVGFQFPFHPGLREGKRLLDQGAIGRPLTARAEWPEYLPDWHPWDTFRQSCAARTRMNPGLLIHIHIHAGAQRLLANRADIFHGHTSEGFKKASSGDLRLSEPCWFLVPNGRFTEWRVCR